MLDVIEEDPMPRDVIQVSISLQILLAQLWA
jgi:hypothetical protein